MVSKHTLFLALFAMCLASMADPASARTPRGRVLFILDGSGSMWAPLTARAHKGSDQVDEPKIAVARRLLTDLVTGLPDAIAPGLQAYGHRRKGDCNDIELLSPMALGARDTLIENIESVRPLGKTPIAKSFELAAQTISKYSGETTVVLVSDGEETCRRDPCDVVQSLREQGVRMHVEVIGLDVNQKERTQLRCIARVGGGQYHDAGSVDQLQRALTRVRSNLVVKISDPEPDQAKQLDNARFIAISRATEQPLARSVEWSLINAQTEHLEVIKTPGSELTLRLPAGRYEVFVRAGKSTGQGYVDVSASPMQTYKVKVNNAIANAIAAPSSIGAGERMLFNWTGPNKRNDMLFVAKPQMAEDHYYLSNSLVHAAKKGSPATLTMPATPGDYEIRYYSFADRAVLARAPVKVTPANVILLAPNKIAAGEVIALQWSGPNAPGDRIFITDTDRPDHYRRDDPDAYHAAKNGYRVQLIAPATPASYEIRYFSYDNNTTLARLPLEVTQSRVTLDAPRMIDGGNAMAVNWSGPNANGDSIVIARADMPEDRYYLAGSPRVATATGNPLVIHAPAKPGTYEIRYYSELNGKILARRALIVR